MLRGGIVPLEFAFIDEHGDRRRGKCFGRRSDGKQCVLIDRLRLVELTYSEAFRKHDAIVFNNRDRNARHSPIFNRLVYILLKLRSRRLRSNRLHRHEKQQHRASKIELFISVLFSSLQILRFWLSLFDRTFGG